MTEKDYFNDKLIRNSYVLEFRKGNQTESLISFSIPPQSEDFQYPQRIAETKTFGGIVYDDYGNDSVRITLSGSTINNEMRFIYSDKGSLKEVDGNAEIELLTETIRKYGKKENLQNKSIYLYQANDNEDSSVNNKFWQVLIQDWRVKRSKDKPMCYDYTIQMIGIADDVSLTKNLDKLEEKVQETIETPEIQSIDTEEIIEIPEVVDNGLSEIVTKSFDIRTCLDGINNFKGLRYILNENKKFTEIINKVNTVISTVDQYTKLINGTISKGSEIIKESMGLVDSAYNTVFRVTMGNTLSIYQAVSSLFGTVKDFTNWGREYLSSDKYKATWNSYKLGFEETTDDIKDYCAEIFGKMDDDVNKSIQVAKKMSADTQIFSVPGKEGENDSIVKTYGSSKYTVNDTDTWDSIAYDNYGDPSLGITIAAFNPKVELKAGVEIYLPYFYPKDFIYSSEIINQPDDRDNYGVDVYALDDYQIDANGDFKVISGENNLKQSVANRLATDVDNRIRLIAYGIRNPIGKKIMSASYICASIKQTLLADTRIAAVDKITFTGKGDQLNITVNYTDINNEQKSFNGVV